MTGSTTLAQIVNLVTKEEVTPNVIPIARPPKETHRNEITPRKH
jgi:hypothetical protein